MLGYDFDLLRKELRAEINKQMNEKGFSQSDLASAAGIERTGFNKSLSGQYLFTVEAIDKITEALGLEKGACYHLFLGECVGNRGLRLEKCEKLLTRYFELEKFDSAKEILNLLVEKDTANRERIYKVAESMFQAAEKRYSTSATYEEKEYQQCLYLYKFYAEHETNFHSEELAICHFRLYYIQRFNVDQAYQYFSVLLTFLDKLPFREKLNALERVVTYYYIQSEWLSVIRYCNLLGSHAEQKDDNFYGYALLVNSIVLQELGDFVEAERLTLLYSKIKGYEEAGYGNYLICKIQSGKLDYIDEYLDWLFSVQEKESGLYIILRTLLAHNEVQRAGQVIQRFSPFIREREDNPLVTKHFMKLMYIQGVYFLRIGDYEQGIQYVLRYIAKAFSLNVADELRELLIVFEQYRDQ